MTKVIEKGIPTVEKKIVSISSKRQMTIPQKYFAALGFSDQAECLMRGSELVIRPIKEASSGEFAEQILAELIAEGFAGEALLSEFKRRQANVRPAVERMIDEAELAAHGQGEYFTYDDIFGAEDEL